MIVIEKDQYVALASDYRTRMVADFAKRVRRENSPAASAYGDGALRERIIADLTFAERCGFLEPRDIWRFVRLRYSTDLEEQSESRRRFLSHVMLNTEISPAKRILFIEKNILNVRVPFSADERF